MHLTPMGIHIYDRVHEMLVVQEVKNHNNIEYPPQHRAISLPPMPGFRLLPENTFQSSLYCFPTIT